MDEELVIMIVIMPIFVAGMAWAFKTALEHLQKQKLVKVHYALQDKILEKLGSSPETVEYLRSNAVENVLRIKTTERPNPFRRILTALQAGAVISLLGIGFIVIRGMLTLEGAEAFTVIGVLALSLGLGFLASSGAAYYFSKQWGLINGSNEDDA